MKNYTDLNIILDRSGSMAPIADAMEGGLKEFIDREKQSGDDTKVSLFQFSDDYTEMFVDRDVNTVGAIQIESGGMTALFDAVGKTMDAVGVKLGHLPEEDRPNRVLFLVITDGAENSSKEYSLSRIQEMIKHQRETYAWDFVFLGTTEDALFQGELMGLGQRSTRGFDRSRDSILSSMRATSTAYQIYKGLDRSNVSTRATTMTFDDTAADTMPLGASTSLSNKSVVTTTITA